MFNEEFCLYILLCNDGSYYTGHTDNLEKRLVEHQGGKIDSYTSKRLPVKLIYSKLFTTRDDAFVAEQKVKGWTRKKKEALIRNDWKILEK